MTTIFFIFEKYQGNYSGSHKIYLNEWKQMAVKLHKICSFYKNFVTQLGFLFLYFSNNLILGSLIIGKNKNSKT